MEKIKKIEWDRIYLKLLFENAIDTPFFIKKKDKKIKIPTEWINKNIISIPVTYTQEDEMLSEGTWELLHNEEICKIEIQEAKMLENRSKVFFYGKGKYAYIVSFQINENFELQIKVNYMIKNKKIKKRRILVESNNNKEIIKNFFLKCFKATIKLYYLLLSFFYKKNGKKILFMSETRSPISGNLKAIDERIKERKLDKYYQLDYSFRKVLQEKKSVLSWLKLTTKLAKADYVFVDDYAPIFSFLTLRNTKLIQVWHAGVGFKSVGYARFGKEGSPYPYESAHRKYDYVTVASKKLIPIYQEVFGLSKEHFIVTGLPRLDGYFEKMEQVKNKLYDKYPSLKNKKIILFAPTYRGEGQKDAYYDFSKIDLKKLYQVCKDKYVVLFKFHPFIRNKIEIDNKYEKILKDVSEYSDINELFYITDILITDYSSNIYEFSLFEKPILFYDYDMEEYSILRGVHDNLENSPGDVCKTFDELLLKLQEENYSIDKVKKFKRDNMDYFDSKSSDRVIDTIIKPKNVK